MAHIGKEMQRQGFNIPLMIGGATTSKAHTAVKIDPNYNEPVVWVKDASRAVGVAQSLISRDMRAKFVDDLKQEYDAVREGHAKRRQSTEWLSLEQARKNKPDIAWKNYKPKKPKFVGTGYWNDYPLEKIRDYIDWTPFFHTWELKGSYPKIFEDADKGEEARKLFTDASIMLEQIIKEKWLTAKAVIGIFPANQVGDDDIEVYTDDSRKQVKTTLHHLRQQTRKADDKPNYCLADFVAPKSSKIKEPSP
jgi:5-methyltetrahydrofolate--homocysteine methyltransferase